jgi:hypothetical protein
LQQHNFKLGLKPAAAAAAEFKEMRIILIFSISFKVLHEEMAKWKWPKPNSLPNALASSLNQFIIFVLTSSLISPTGLYLIFGGGGGIEFGINF